MTKQNNKICPEHGNMIQNHPCRIRRIIREEERREGGREEGRKEEEGAHQQIENIFADICF